MSRIASVKETGEEVSQADWQRFEQAVLTEAAERPSESKERGDIRPAADPQQSVVPQPRG